MLFADDEVCYFSHISKENVKFSIPSDTVSECDILSSEKNSTCHKQCIGECSSQCSDGKRKNTDAFNRFPNAQDYAIIR